MQLLWLAMPGVELSTIESACWHYIIVMYQSSTSHDSEAANGMDIPLLRYGNSYLFAFNPV